MPAVALEPQLVDRASRPPEGDSWIHEIKYDGYRLLASVQRGKVWLYSRSGADWTTKLPWIAKAVGSLGVGEVLLDGELVYLDDDGFPDFERLWSATRGRRSSAALLPSLRCPAPEREGPDRAAAHRPEGREMPRRRARIRR